MSAESSSITLGVPTNVEIPRPSMDGSISLNDDLAESEFGGSVVSHPTIARLGSIRNSIDDSSFSNSQYNILNTGELGQDFSPIGPNSIYELTVASDLSRIKQRRIKTSVLLNGGLTTVNNLVTPTTNNIPPIHLSRLNNKVSDDKLNKHYVAGITDEYKKFESSYNVLTKDVLDKLNQGYGAKKSSNSDSDCEFDNGNDHEHENLNSIPPVFMNSDFKLDDPRIFKQVIENVAILPQENSSSFTESLSNNTKLHEKFSNYLDSVELNLIQEISKSSDSFFTTIGDITKIKQQSDDVLTKYNQTREKLTVLQKKQISQGSSIISNIMIKKNVILFESCLLQLSYITKIFKLANISFNNGKYDKCMNEVVLVESLIYGMDIQDPSFTGIPLPKPLQDLSSLPALINVINDLGSLKNDCAKGFINEFVTLLIEDLRNHYQSIPTQTTFNRLYIASDIHRKYPSSDPNYKSYQIINPKTKTKLTDLISNLVKSNHILSAYSAYQDRLIIEIKEIIKHNIPNSSTAGFTQHDDYSSADISQVSSRASSAPPPDNQDNSHSGNAPQNLSTSIKSLTPREFESMLKKTYANLSECLRCLTTHQKLLLDLALTYIPTNASFDVMALDITSAINKAIELTQIRLTKVINVRSEQIADLPVPFYLSLYAISSAYLQECESINPGYVSTAAGSTLSEWFKHHISYFIHRVHSKALKTMVTNVDKEIWREINEPNILNEHQVIVDEIIRFSENTGSNTANFINELWFSMLDFYEGDGKQIKVVNIPQDSSKSSISIKDESFLVPNLILQALLHLKDYLIVFKMFPHHAHTIENNLLNYFKFMNSKISQSVLNAGATRTAGLRHITTKNIALCIQTIEYNISLLPYLQTIFYPKNTPRPPTNTQNQDDLTFSRIMSNYKDHENELFAKLVAIMYDRTTNHSAAALKIDWSQPLSREQQCHPYMEALVKETLTITKVLTKYLPEIKCSLILSQVFDNYKKSFVTCYCVDLPQPKDMIEKQMVLKDIDYFRSQLCDLPGYGNSGQVIWENVNSLPTLEDSKMEEKMRIHEDAAARNKQIEAKTKAKSFEESKAEIVDKSKDKSSDTIFEIPTTEDGQQTPEAEINDEISESQLQNGDDDNKTIEERKLDEEIMNEIKSGGSEETGSKIGSAADELKIDGIKTPNADGDTAQVVDDSFMDTTIVTPEVALNEQPTDSNDILEKIIGQKEAGVVDKTNERRELDTDIVRVGTNETNKVVHEKVDETNIDASNLEVIGKDNRNIYETMKEGKVENVKQETPAATNTATQSTNTMESTTGNEENRTNDSKTDLTVDVQDKEDARNISQMGDSLNKEANVEPTNNMDAVNEEDKPDDSIEKEDISDNDFSNKTGSKVQESDDAAITQKDIISNENANSEDSTKLEEVETIESKPETSNNNKGGKKANKKKKKKSKK